MSIVKVWVEPEGNWSKEFSGLDKIHIIKDAILHQCRKDPPEEGCCELLKGMEIDAVELQVCDDYYHPIEIDGVTDEILSEEVIHWHAFERSNHVSIASAKILKLPFLLFDEMAKADAYFSSVYNDIIKAARVFDPTVPDYCLLLKFEDE